MPQSKDVNLKVPISTDEKILFQAAAGCLGQTVPQFILKSAVDKANELLGEDGECEALQLEGLQNVELINSESELLREKAVERLMDRKAPWE